MRTTPQSWTHPRLARDSSRDRRVNALQSDVRSGPRRAAIIGCGVVGLSTARLLQRRGWQVTIYARDLPPNTTSNVAIGPRHPSLKKTRWPLASSTNSNERACWHRLSSRDASRASNSSCATSSVGIVLQPYGPHSEEGRGASVGGHEAREFPEPGSNNTAAHDGLPCGEGIRST